MKKYHVFLTVDVANVAADSEEEAKEKMEKWVQSVLDLLNIPGPIIAKAEAAAEKT